jgi:hypothetical protein
MPAGAKLCTVCKSYQAWWRNEFNYWAGIAGITSGVAAAVSFTGAAIIFCLKLLVQDMVVPELDSQGRSVFWNQSNGPIWIDTVFADREATKDHFRWKIFQVAEPSKPLAIDLAKIAGCDWTDFDQKLMDRGGVLNMAYLPKPGDTVPPGAFTQSDYDDWNKNDFTARTNYIPRILLSEGSTMKSLDANRDWAKVDFQCKLTYRRVGDGTPQEMPIACMGVLMHHDFSKEPLPCPGSS